MLYLTQFLPEKPTFHSMVLKSVVYVKLVRKAAVEIGIKTI
jgi:hypothetical protein